MTKPLTPGERVQIDMERFRGPQKPPRPQNITKPNYKVHKTPKQNFKANRGR